MSNQPPPIPPFCEVAPFPAGTFREGRFIGERLLETPWDSVGDLLEWLDFPPNNLWPYAEFGGWSTSAPIVKCEVFPKPGSRVSVSGRTGAKYEWAHVKLLYDTGEMMYLPPLFVHEKLERTRMEVAQSNRCYDLYWASDLAPLEPFEVSMNVEVGVLVYEITLFRLLATPTNFINLWQRTNASLYVTATLGVQFAPGTMLMVGGQVNRNSKGALVRNLKEVTYRFWVRSANWNYLFRAEYGTFEPVKLATGEFFVPYPPAVMSWQGLAS